MAKSFDYSNIAAKWKELSGTSNWEGLVTPQDVDLDLRRYILHYCDMALATSDSYIGTDLSPHKGQCRYTKGELLDSVGLIKGRNGITEYEVTKFLYISSKTVFGLFEGTTFGGYVAVASDTAKEVLGRRDILVAWRGSNHLLEFVENLKALPIEDPAIFPADPTTGNVVPKVHDGFHEMYTLTLPDNKLGRISVRKQALSEIERLVEQYKGEEMSITIAGHSMGSALGTLLATDIVAHGYNKPKGTNTVIPVTVIISGTPRVGDSAFAKYIEGRPDLHILRVVNVPDKIPLLPPEEWGYQHVGLELKVDSSKSPYLLKPDDQFGKDSFAHFDQAYFHAVAGSHGEDGPFELELDRDLALLNKSFSALANAQKLRVPEQWFIAANKGMALKDDGTWVLDGDVPPPEF